MVIISIIKISNEVDIDDFCWVLLRYGAGEKIT